MRKRRASLESRCLACLVLLGLACASAALAATLQVCPDGSGPYPTIQAAINEAVDGDVIELTDGTFVGPGNRGIDYLGKAITVRSQSGDPQNCEIDCQGVAQGVICVSGEGPQSVLSGVTLANGSSSSGGAVYLSNTSPTFINCIFSGNHSQLGGAIYT